MEGWGTFHVPLALRRVHSRPQTPGERRGDVPTWEANPGRRRAGEGGEADLAPEPREGTGAAASAPPAAPSGCEAGCVV